MHKPTNYLYQGLSNVLHKEYGQSGSLYAEYYIGAEDQLVSRKMFGMHGLSNPSHDPNLKTTGGMLYYQFDGQRTVSETTDRHGDWIERYRYDAFGGIFTGITAPYNHNAYTGQKYDAKTGLLDMNARWYDPLAARFMTADTYPGELDYPLTQNRYAYVLNNPVNMWDPTGHVPLPYWVYLNDTYYEIDKIDPSVTDFWFFESYWENPLSDTVLVDSIDQGTHYLQIYEQTIMRNWMYRYERIKNVEDVPKTIRGPEDQHFQEEVVVRWDDKLTAEEVARQNEEVIASYGPSPNARIISSKTFLNGDPYTADMIYNKTKHGERERILRMQMANQLGQNSVGFWEGLALDSLEYLKRTAVNMSDFVAGFNYRSMDNMTLGIHSTFIEPKGDPSNQGKAYQLGAVVADVAFAMGGASVAAAGTASTVVVTSTGVGVVAAPATAAAAAYGGTVSVKSLSSFKEDVQMLFSKEGSGQGTGNSPYSNIPDSKSVGPGKNFTKTQKQKIIEENMKRNDGKLKSDLSGEELVPAQKSQKGVKPPQNEVQIDHIDPRSKGGSNSYGNAQVTSRKENRDKWDK